MPQPMAVGAGDGEVIMVEDGCTGDGDGDEDG